MNAKSYDRAIELYRKAYERVPHPALLYNIGLAHKLAGRFDQAVTFYQRYLTIAPNGAQAGDARAALAEIQAASTAAASVTTREHDSSGEPKEEGSGGAVVADEPAKVYVGVVGVVGVTAARPALRAQRWSWS